MAAGNVKHIALVGYGRIAPKHLEVLRAHGAEVVACCNLSEEGRHKAEAEGGIPRTYASITEMMKRERPDGIVSCASMHHIYDTGCEIIPFKIPTLLEKPPGNSVAEHTHLCQLAEQYGTPVMVGLNRRHYSVVNRAVEDAGGNTRITAVTLEWSEEPQRFLKRGFTVDQVSRLVFGNSLHGLDLLTYLAGPISDLDVRGLSLGKPLKWAMSLEGVSQRGCLVTFNSTWDSPGRWRLSFCAPGRRYVLAPLESCLVLETGAEHTRHIEPDDVDKKFKPGFYRQTEQFLKMIDTRKAPPLSSLQAAAPAMKLAESLTLACLAAEERT